MTEKELDLLEALMEMTVQRIVVVKAIGKEQPIVYELDRVIDNIKKEILDL